VWTKPQIMYSLSRNLRASPARSAPSYPLLECLRWLAPARGDRRTDEACSGFQADCPLDKVRGFVLDIGEDGSLTEADFIGFFRKMRSSAQKSRYEAAASRAYTPAPVDGTWLLVEELSSPGTPRGKARFKPSVLLSPSSPSASSRTPLAPKAASSLEESGGVRPAVHTNSLAWSFLARGVARKVAQKIVTDSLLTFMCFPIRRAQMIVQTCDAFSGLGECLHALTRDCTGLFRGYLSGVASSFVWEVTGVITNCIMRVLVPTYDRESDMALWAVTNVWKRSFPPRVQILASYPLTMAEVRLALDFGPGPREFGGILDCIRGVNQSEGVVGIYKGVGAMMMGMCCQQTISLVIRKTLIRLFKPGRPFKPWERIALDEPAQIVAGALTTPFFFLHFKYINGNVQGKKLLEEAWYRGAFTSGIIVEVSNRAVWTATPMVMRRISGAVQDYFNELPVEMYRPIGDPGFDRFIQSAASRTPHDAKRTRAHLFIDFSKSERPPLTPKHHSLMAKYLSDRTWLKYRDVKTATGFSFSNLIQCGVMQRASAIGIVLGDEHSSEVFKDLVHPIVKAWHKIDPHYQKQTQGDLDASKLVLTDIQRLRFQAKVVSCRICCSRNLSGLCTACQMLAHLARICLRMILRSRVQLQAIPFPPRRRASIWSPLRNFLEGRSRDWPPICRKR